MGGVPRQCLFNGGREGKANVCSGKTGLFADYASIERLALWHSAHPARGLASRQDL